MLNVYKIYNLSIFIYFVILTNTVEANKASIECQKTLEESKLYELHKVRERYLA